MASTDSAPALARESVGFQTSEGTLHVSQPFRSSATNHKLRAMITFTPRKSHFDISNESSGQNEFRGFFSLFWISMFIFSVRTYVRSIETNGYPLELAFASMFSRDAVALALSDAALVLSTGLAVPFVNAIKHRHIRYYWTGVVIQHLWQVSLLVTAITWTFNRQWPWVQSGFLTLHSIVMIMKVHSYVATNGQLQTAYEQADELFVQLHRATAAEGGWDAAIAAATANQPVADPDPAPSGSGTPLVPEGTTSSYIDARTALALRQRLAAVPATPATPATPETLERSTQMKTTGTRVSAPAPPTAPPSPSQVLAHHPASHVATLARAHAELEAELTSTGPARVRYPTNVSLRNFAVYQLIPTLVYELEYPRTERIRPLYVFEKTVATFGTFALLYTVVESFILPLTPTPDQSFLRSLLDLALPFMIAYLLLFYIIFECICNGFAELSCFADRRFYDDWVRHACDPACPLLTIPHQWNSTSWDEFARKWNRPVHTFLLRHVYASTMASYALSRNGAMFVTFVISALAHELVMTIVTKKIRMYLFTLQLIQIPLIAIGRIPAIKRNKLLGNLVFWCGMYVGLPLLCVAYVAY